MLEVVQFPARVATASLGVLGIMGGILSITGVFGMAAYSVSKRLRELGIRVALGAQRREVLQAALGRAFKLLAVGSGAGLLLGIVASRVLGFHCVSGNTARSAGIGECNRFHGSAGRDRDMDTRAAGVVGRSAALIARRLDYCNVCADDAGEFTPML